MAAPFRPYRVAVFDFDGTLADSFPFFLDTFDVLADAHGFRRLDRSQLDSLRELDARQMMREFQIPLWKIPRVATHFKRLMAERVHHIRLFDGIAPMLQCLHAQGTQLALLTSNAEHNVRAVLGAELCALFAHLQCGSSLFGKQRRLRSLLAHCKAAPHEVLCIGDELRDLQAAHAERLAFGAVAWGYTRPQALLRHGPALMFEQPEDICAAFGAGKE